MIVIMGNIKTTWCGYIIIIVIIRKRADVCNMLDTKNDIYPASG